MTKDELIAGINLLGGIQPDPSACDFTIPTESNSLNIKISVYYRHVWYLCKLYDPHEYKELLKCLAKDIVNANTKKTN